MLLAALVSGSPAAAQASGGGTFREPPLSASWIGSGPGLLPSRSVTTVAQDHHGFLWVGSFGGLARFDGREWRRVRHEAHLDNSSIRITALQLSEKKGLAARDPRSLVLWIGTEEGAVTRVSGGEAVPLNTPVLDLAGARRKSLPVTKILPIADDVALVRSGKHLWCAGQWTSSQTTHPPQAGEATSSRSFSVTALERGGDWIYIGTTDGILRISASVVKKRLKHALDRVPRIGAPRDDAPSALDLIDGASLIPETGGLHIRGLAVDPSSNRLVFMSQEGLAQLDEAGVFEAIKAPRLAADFPGVGPAIMRLGPGGMLHLSIGTCHYEEGELREGRYWPVSKLDWPQVVPEVQSSSFVRAILPNPEGGAWLATTEGLARVRRTPLRTASRMNFEVRSICDDGEGGVYVGSILGGVFQHDGDSVLESWASDVEGRPIHDVHSLLRRRNGAVWLAAKVDGRYVPLRKDADGFRAVAGWPEELRHRVRCLYETRAGHLILGGEVGLWVYDDQAEARGTEAFRALAPTLSGSDVHCVRETPQGRLVVAATEGVVVLELPQPLFADEASDEPSEGPDNAIRTAVYSLRGARYMQVRFGQVRDLWIEAATPDLPQQRTLPGQVSEPIRIYAAAYGGGLAIHDGRRWQRIGRADGLEDLGLSRILPWGGNGFLLNGNDGAHFLRRDTIDRWLAEGGRVAVHSYPRASGFVSGEGTGGGQPAGCIDGQGRAWLPSLEGPRWMAAEELVHRPPPERRPQILVTACHVGATRSTPRRRLEVDYLDEDLLRVRPEAGERRLELTVECSTVGLPHGFELAWRTDAEGAVVERVPVRDGRIRLYDLPPGDHDFALWASRSQAGPPAEDELLRLRIAIPPTFWERGEVRFGLLGLAALLVPLSIWLGRLDTRRRAQALRALVGERTRSLRREIEVRELAEKELLGIQSELDAKVRERTKRLADTMAARAATMEEKQRLERQLFEAQKLESVGRLAGGLAHEINNTMTAVIGFSELAETASEGRASALQPLAQVRHAAERAAGLTEKLLVFARRQATPSGVMDLDLLLRNQVPMIRRVIGEAHVLTVDHPDAKVPVLADVAQIESVLLNLCINARDAMSEPGRLLIGLTRISAAKARKSFGFQREIGGECAVLEVSDTGGGIPPEISQRVFDPFFTTKKEGEGTGLGLSICYGTIKQSGGEIRFESEAGVGTTFRVLLPIAQGAGVAMRASGEASASVKKPRACVDQAERSVLVVEDEAQVRDAVQAMLKGRRWKVRAVDGARSAMMVWRAAPKAFDVILSDVVMPQVGGFQLAMELRREGYCGPLVFMSGYTDDDLVAEDLEAVEATLIRKPFGAVLLDRRLREALPVADPSDAGSDEEPPAAEQEQGAG